MGRDKWGFYGAALFIALIVTLLNQKLVIEGMITNSDGTYCADGFLLNTARTQNKCNQIIGDMESSSPSFQFIGCPNSTSMQPSFQVGCVYKSDLGPYLTITPSAPVCPAGSTMNDISRGGNCSLCNSTGSCSLVDACPIGEYHFKLNLGYCVKAYSLNPLTITAPTTTTTTSTAATPTTVTPITTTTTATTAAPTPTPTPTPTDKKEWYEEPVNIGIITVCSFIVLMILLTR